MATWSGPWVKQPVSARIARVDRHSAIRHRRRCERHGARCLSRVVQGLATGIGFIGAGAILNLEYERAIRGLTTAAGLWMTAALGVTVGLGHIGAAAIGVLCAWIVLSVLIRLENAIGSIDADSSPTADVRSSTRPRRADGSLGVGVPASCAYVRSGERRSCCTTSSVRPRHTLH